MRYCFGDHELDTDTVELRGPAGNVAIEPQVFNVLQHLLAHRERVVSKEEILDNVWGDRFVSESALTSRIKSARQAVGDDGKSQAVIKTVHGRGYRFVAEVAENHAADPTPAPVPTATAPEPNHAAGVQVGQRFPASEAEEPAPVATRSDDLWPLLGRHRELALLAQRFNQADTSAVLITGPAGHGKTRLAREAARMAGDAGIPVAYAGGHPEASNVPLACLAHLLPAAVSAGGMNGELSRGLLFQRATDAMDELSRGARLLLLVDDIDHVDDLSQAVIASLVMGDRVFAVLTQRTDGSTLMALQHLLSGGQMDRLDLGPLAREVLDVTLYRALGAPIDRHCLDTILDASDGSPGICRQLVEGSIHRGTLRQVDGVWRLDGDLAPPASLGALVEERLAHLSADHGDAAELLAVAGDLDLDLAIEMLGDEVLDGLDLQGFVTIDETDSADSGSRHTTTVRLAHPLYGEVLRSRLTRLRSRRLRARLADAMESLGPNRAGDRLRIVRWRLESGGAIEAADLLESARLAVLHKDDKTARQLLGRIQADHPSPEAQQLDAELCFRAGDMTEAERLLADIDLDAMDPELAAQVVRRRATNIFYGRWEFDDAISLVETRLAGSEGTARLILESHWISMAILTRQLGPALHRGEELLTDAEGAVRLELARAVAFGRALSGRFQDALDAVTESRALAAELPPSIGRPGLSLAGYTELVALIEGGRLETAQTLADGFDTEASGLGWFTPGLGLLANLRGQPQVTIDQLANPAGLADAIGFKAFAAWLKAYLAEAWCLLGDIDTAAALAEEIRPYIADPPSLVHLDMIGCLTHVQVGQGDQEGALDTTLAALRRSLELGLSTVAASLAQRAAHLGAGAEAWSLLEPQGFVVEGPAMTARIDDIRAHAEGDLDRHRSAATALDDLGFVVLAARSYQSLATALTEIDPEEAKLVRKRSEELVTHDNTRLRL